MVYRFSFKIQTLLLILGPMPALSAGTTPPDLSPTLSMTVFNCSDGDTCRIGIPEKLWFNVRLAGIDAPETSKKKRKLGGQVFGEDAKKFLNTLLQGKSVQVQQHDLDPFNRPVVELLINGESAGLKLVREGLAEVYQGKTKRLDKTPYLAAQTEAQKAKRGIWSSASYISPQKFREKQRNNKP